MATKTFELRDLKARHVVEIRVDDKNRVWVNVDQRCVLRIAGAPDVAIFDDRLGSLAYTPTREVAKPAEPTVAFFATVEP